MTAEIFYFSGTGNSLHVATLLARRLGASLSPVVGRLRNGETTTDADVVGFVFPTHALCIPIAVRRLLRVLVLRRSAYLFAVATREGTAFHGFRQMNRLLRSGGHRLHAEFVVTMPATDPRPEGYRPPDPEEMDQVRARIDERLDDIATTVERHGAHLWSEQAPPIPTARGKMKSGLVERLVVLAHTASEYAGGVNYFYADHGCSACGICGSVCLSGKIQPDASGRPRWRKDVLCYMCFACVNFCPKQSVQIRSIWALRSHSVENPRYGHPFASAAAIASQKLPPDGSFPTRT